MKFSVNWLREFVDLPDKIDKLAELLTLAGVEIEGIEERGAKIDKVIVAQIKESSRHPNADRLSVCVVDDGSGQTRQIVCGATNYKVGDKVPLALPGAVLPNGLEIKKSKLRGVESEGMLCSGKELGFSEDAAGLLILSPDAKIGAAIADLFPSDTILDVEITPNRGDLLSHYGLAREISALVGQPLRSPSQLMTGGAPALQKKNVEIAAPNECPFLFRAPDRQRKSRTKPRLVARKDRSGRNSFHQQRRGHLQLRDAGAWPTHARLRRRQIEGRNHCAAGAQGRKISRARWQDLRAHSKDLVIADQERVVGIGGVMGGEETGVTESTQNILLEAAYFLPSSVRRTARTLNLPSDASYRFERGVDTGMILRASQRAAGLIAEIAGGNPAKELLFAGKLPANPADVSLSHAKCDQVLGIKIEAKTADEILERFGLTRTKTRRLKAVGPKTRPGSSDGDETKSSWTIPSYRRDLQRDVDLIEEIVRAHGVDKIAGTDRSRFTPTSPADISHDLEMELRHKLAARGLNEARTSKLIPRSGTGASNAPAFSENAIELRNPLSEDHVALRPSLIGGLLEVLGRNVRAGAETVAIFEIGRTFIPPSGKEERHLGVLLWGNTASAPSWRLQASRRLDLFDLKGAIASVVPELSFRQANYPDLALGVELWSHDQRVGFAGQLSATKSTVPGAVLVAELHFDTAFVARNRPQRFFELKDRFPSVTRDIAMIVPEKISHAEILRAIENPKEPLLESVALFDLFIGEELGAARKSLAYTLTYRDRSRTLTSEEVTAAHAKIRERLRRELGAELRE